MTSDLRVLFFDVFGTCVDWRKTVTDGLYAAAQETLKTSAGDLNETVKERALATTHARWGEFAQAWRTTYHQFTRKVASDSSLRWKTVDQHHLDALYDLLEQNGLLLPTTTGDTSNKAGKGSLWNDEQIHDLSLIWHRLDPWSDTCEGIRELNKRFQTSTLTNGNLALITDMAAHAKMDFTHIFSAEMFNSYKPNPAVYLGAAKKLDVQPSQCAMVAAHLDDLAAAKKCGFRTVYVERPLEERFPEMGEDPDLVDVWVKEDEDGFVAAARKLGVPAS